ncbi:MAG TPA: heme-binding beta-barrel domain-containing protein [Acidimicrobiales bacterium]|nr:heme-binding beta-barrel domain-containing protein [Acidimicrobiales bacterium]
MSFEEWGPLAGLIGTWESGVDGVDVSYHNEQGKLDETRFRERTTFKNFGPVDNGPQCLYGLDYRTIAWREGEDNPFHTEVGYWMWDASEHQVMRCFMVPRASTLIAGGTVEPTATSFTLEAVLGSNTYGILSNKYLDRIAKTTRFNVEVTVNEDTFSYDETTVVEHVKWPTVVMHTDRNTLRRLSWEA